MSIPLYPTYSQMHSRFLQLPDEARITVSASLPAIEGWLYQEHLLPTERDIRIMHKLNSLPTQAQADQYLCTIPMWKQYFQCYAPMTTIIRLMHTHFLDSEKYQDEYRHTQNGTVVVAKLFHDIVGFPLGDNFQQLASDYASAVLDPASSADFLFPRSILPYIDWKVSDIIQYPTQFVFQRVLVRSMPDSEKKLLADRIKHDPSHCVNWFHGETWAANVNPVDDYFRRQESGKGVSPYHFY